MSAPDGPRRERADALTHLDAEGKARMVDVTDKPATRRRAVAEGRIRMAAETARAIRAGDAPKGDVLGTARLAGIMAGKRTSDLIPLCHPLPGTTIAVELTVDEALPGVRARAEAAVEGQT